MWEGPFECYVWLDSDAIVWGDFTPQIRMDVDFQIFWSEISIPADATEIPAWLPHFYFDPLEVAASLILTSTGAGMPISARERLRAGVMPYRLKVWESRLSRWRRQFAGVICRGDMGMVNYLVHSMAQRGRSQNCRVRSCNTSVAIMG